MSLFYLEREGSREHSVFMTVSSVHSQVFCKIKNKITDTLRVKIKSRVYSLKVVSSILVNNYKKVQIPRLHLFY